MNADARFWDRIAEKYAAKPVANVPAYERKLALTKARLRRSDVILDIGCGTGSLAIELAPRVSHVHAVDVSNEMLRLGRKKASDRGIDNVTFHQSAAEALPKLAAESLDGACAFSILHLVRDRAAIYRQIMAMLKPGAFFISSSACLGESPLPYGLILPVMRWLGQAPAVEIFSVKGLLRELRDAGFSDVSTKEVGAKRTVAFVVANKPT